MITISPDAALRLATEARAFAAGSRADDASTIESLAAAVESLAAQLKAATRWRSSAVQHEEAEAT